MLTAWQQSRFPMTPPFKDKSYLQIGKTQLSIRLGKLYTDHLVTAISVPPAPSKSFPPTPDGSQTECHSWQAWVLTFPLFLLHRFLYLLHFNLAHASFLFLTSIPTVHYLRRCIFHTTLTNIIRHQHHQSLKNLNEPGKSLQNLQAPLLVLP